MSDRPKWAPKGKLTAPERQALEACIRAVECLTLRTTYKNTGYHESAFGMLEKACGLIAQAREALCWNEETMFGFCQALRPIANQHAPQLAMTLMAWELRMWPGQTPDDKPVATAISTPV